MQIIFILKLSVIAIVVCDTIYNKILIIYNVHQTLFSVHHISTLHTVIL